MSPQILSRAGADAPAAANPATPRHLSPEGVAGAPAVIGDLLATLGIRWQHLVLIPCTEGWCLTLQCRVAGRFRAFLLELSADAVQAAEQGGARRRALAVELDEYLAECERIRQ
ncbi:MAG: hypothetical protein GVY09_06680 [Gammaproteobacteria bacterium]|jgi:hypothetical protein|nr:hypothetical protein [Gammaproteobacteria bacterium]